MDDLSHYQLELDKIMDRLPEKIKTRLAVKNIAPGETITKKGEAANYVYLLVAGNARVTNEFPNGERYIFAQITSTSFVGELEVLAGEAEYASNVEATTACKVLVLTANDFTKWIEADSAILMEVAKVLAKKMYLTSSETGTVKFFSGMRKLQAYIVRYCRRIKEGEIFLINRNRQQIADEIGTSVKTVNRGVEKLKNDNLVLIKRGKIYITKEQYTNMMSMIESV